MDEKRKTQRECVLHLFAVLSPWQDHGQAESSQALLRGRGGASVKPTAPTIPPLDTSTSLGPELQAGLPATSHCFAGHRRDMLQSEHCSAGARRASSAENPPACKEQGARGVSGGEEKALPQTPFNPV